MAKLRVFIAKKKAEKEKMKDTETDTHIIYLKAKQMKQENKDTVGTKCIQDDNSVLAFNEDKKKNMETTLWKFTECQILLGMRGSVNCWSSAQAFSSYHDGEGGKVYLSVEKQ